MSRTNLDTGLRNLQDQMIQLALEVEKALNTILRSLETGKHDPLLQVIENAFCIDSLCAMTQQQALRLLILQQPLGGQDLRFLTATLFISENLNHIKDALVQIARTLLEATSLYHQTVSSSPYAVDGNAVDQQGHLTDVFILRGLLFLGREIEHILATARVAFTQRDAVMAHTIEAEQDLVVLRYAPICQNIMEMQAQMSAHATDQRDASFLQRITCLLWIAHKLAEIATYVTHSCQRIIFIVEG